MNLELDQYFTPQELAEELIRGTYSYDSCVAIDPTCGGGNLLKAASNVFSKIECVGIDKDVGAIRRLRRNNPDWTLSAADLLCNISCRGASAVKKKNLEEGLLLLNPPFSHKKNKSIDACYFGITLKASVAMTYILRSFDLFSPNRGGFAVVPESVLFSETDANARALLLQTNKIELITELSNSTFSGARVRSSIIKISPLAFGSKEIGVNDTAKPKFNEKHVLIRGALAVHLSHSEKNRQGIPFVHSTDINYVLGNSLDHLTRVKSDRKGEVSGAVILIPRVGVPKRSLIKAVKLDERVHLSDCVIALKFESFASAKRAEGYLRRNFSSFEGLYRGTAARYITLSRLENWLL